MQGCQGVRDDHEIMGLRIHRDEGTANSAVVVVETRGSGASIASASAATKATTAAETTATTKPATAATTTAAAALLGYGG